VLLEGWALRDAFILPSFGGAAGVLNQGKAFGVESTALGRWVTTALRQEIWAIRWKLTCYETNNSWRELRMGGTVRERGWQ